MPRITYKNPAVQKKQQSDASSAIHLSFNHVRLVW